MDNRGRAEDDYPGSISLIESQLCKSAEETGAMDAEHSGRLGLVAPGSTQGTLKQLPFDLGQKLIENDRLLGTRRMGRSGTHHAQSVRKVGLRDPGAGGILAGLLHHVRQLVDVSRPRQSSQLVKCVGRKAAQLKPAAGIELLHQLLGK